MTLRCTESYFSCLFNLQLLLLCLRTSKKVGSTYKWYNLSVGGKQKHKPSFDGKAPISWAKTGHPDACAEGEEKNKERKRNPIYHYKSCYYDLCFDTHSHSSSWTHGEVESDRMYTKKRNDSNPFRHALKCLPASTATQIDVATVGAALVFRVWHDKQRYIFGSIIAFCHIRFCMPRLTN